MLQQLFYLSLYFGLYCLSGRKYQQLEGTQNELSQQECDKIVEDGVVIALAKSLHDPSKSNIFSGNYFAGLPLFIYLI